MKSVIEGARAILAATPTSSCAAAPRTCRPLRPPAEHWGARMGDKKVVDTMIKDGLWDAFNNYHMGTTAENICDVWGITREESWTSLAPPPSRRPRPPSRPAGSRTRSCPSWSRRRRKWWSSRWTSSPHAGVHPGESWAN